MSTPMKLEEVECIVANLIYKVSIVLGLLVARTDGIRGVGSDEGIHLSSTSVGRLVQGSSVPLVRSLPSLHRCWTGSDYRGRYPPFTELGVAKKSERDARELMIRNTLTFSEK